MQRKPAPPTAFISHVPKLFSRPLKAGLSLFHSSYWDLYECSNQRLNLLGTQAAAGTRLGRHCSQPGAFCPLFLPTQQHWDLHCSAQPAPPPPAFACLTPSYQPQLPLVATRQSGAPQQGHNSTPAARAPRGCVAVPGLSQLRDITVCDKESNAGMKKKGRQRGDNTKQFQVGRTSVSDSLRYLPAHHCVIFPREDFRKARKISILHSLKATSTPL